MYCGSSKLSSDVGVLLVIFSRVVYTGVGGGQMSVHDVILFISFLFI